MQGPKLLAILTASLQPKRCHCYYSSERGLLTGMGSAGLAGQRFLVRLDEELVRPLRPILLPFPDGGKYLRDTTNDHSPTMHQNRPKANRCSAMLGCSR